MFDTNALISAHILPFSVSRKAPDKATSLGILVYLSATLYEFSTVFMRPKFNPYQTVESRLAIVASFEKRNQLIAVTQTLQASRDKADNMFLELALSAPTKAVITGRSRSAFAKSVSGHSDTKSRRIVLLHTFIDQNPKEAPPLQQAL